MIHCYIKHRDPYVEIVENDGKIRKAIEYNLTIDELVSLQDQIGMAINKMNSYLDDDSLPF
jgi:hypothetical protein